SPPLAPQAAGVGFDRARNLTRPTPDLNQSRAARMNHTSQFYTPIGFGEKSARKNCASQRRERQRARIAGFARILPAGAIFSPSVRPRFTAAQMRFRTGRTAFASPDRWRGGKKKSPPCTAAPEQPHYYY